MNFPFKRNTMNNLMIQGMFTKLQNYNPKLSSERFALTDCSFINDFSYNGEYITFLFDDDDYHNIDIITDYFTEEDRLKANINGYIAPLDLWNLPGYQEFIKNRNKKGEDVREFIYNSNLTFNGYKWRECTQFKVTLAFSVMKMLTKGIVRPKICDFSSGWGDRLIAALALNNVDYTAIDPNPDLPYKYMDMICAFESKSEVTMGTSNFESEKCLTDESEQESFDLIFTSPPFYTHEEYETTKGMKLSVDDWCKNYLFKWLEKSIKLTKRGGFIAIHINNVKVNKGEKNLCEATFNFMNATSAAFQGVIASMSTTSNKRRPIWIWKKL